MNDNINKIQKILQNKVGYQGSSADLMKYLETPENKEKLVKVLNTKVGYAGTVDDFNSYVGIQVPKVEGIQTVSVPSVTVGAPEVNVMSPLSSNMPTTTIPNVDWATQEEGSITKPIAGELEREQPVSFEGMTPDPKNDPDYSVTNQSGKFVYTFDKEKSDRRKEKDAFLTILDEQMKESNKRLEESMAAVKKYNAENPTSGWENFPVAYGGAAFAQHEKEKQKITGGEPQGEIFATQAILKDAEQAFKAPKKGENWAKSFGIGGAETVTDPDAWLFGILSLNEVQQSMSVFEKVEKGESLTDTESALMDAMLTRTQAEAMRSSDTSNWYKGGKIAGESLPFMRDMWMTGGLNTITTAAGKGSVKLAQRATAKYLRKKAEKQLLKEGIDITEDILSRRAADLFMRTAKVADYSGRVLAASTVTPAVRTPLMPTSYSGVAKNMQGRVVGNEFGTYQIQEGDDFGTAVGKQFVEVQSEGVGEFFAPILKGVKLLGGKAIPKIISDSKFGQVGSKVVDAIMLDNPYLQKAGISGIAGEVGEEIFGQTEQYLSGLTTKEDLDNFYSGDNFKSMLIGFAPMSALGIAGNAINYGSNEVQYRRAKKELGGITDELDNSSVGELGNKISDVLIQNNAFDEDGNLTEEGRQLNNNLVSYAQRNMAKDIANDGKQENPNSRYYDFLLNERSKKWLESYLADNDLTAPMYFNLAYKATLHENELTDYERKTLSELDRAFNGYLKAEDAAQQASAEIDTQINPTNNKIQNVMVGGQPYMVKGGNVVMTENEEGKVILDKENSDQVITVVNAEGVPLQIGIEQLESVVGEVDAEEAKNAAIESAHTTAYNETFYPVGSIVYRKDAQGQFSAIKETGADGFTINSVTEGGEVVPTLIENTNSENFGVISLKAGDKYTLNDGTQLDIISNEDGVISASVNGQPSEQTTADELATLFESTGIDLTQFEPSEEDVTETELQEAQQPVETQQVEETQQVQETEAPEVYPTDKKGEPIFEQMPVEQSIKVVREVLGDDAVNFVEDKLKAANKAVKAVAKKAPKSTSLLGRKSEVEAIALEKQKATESLDYWTNVKRLMSEEAIQATREQTPINQVVEKPNQVGQVIINRYESAKKVIGNSATITAPNGKVLKGRYVLVSAYAVTPSHNPFDSYNTSEGFPLNADGSNTNDRDYKNDKANQVVTEDIGSNFDGRALEKVPKVSKKGAIFDGNGTTMGSQLAAANGTDKAYLGALNNNAANYGFTAADLKSISNPRIVFELETELPYTTEAFAMFNSEEKKSESATASAVAKSKQLSPSSVAKIAALVDSYSSLESFFSSGTATAEMVKTLVDAKVINTLEIAKLIDNGLFSATGRELITNVLLGATLNEQAIRQIGNDSSLKGIIVRAMKQILENAKLKEYSLFEDINNAIGLLYEARKAKMSVSDFLLQTNMFEKGASERFSDFEQMLALAMSDSGVLFKGTIDKYNTVAAPLVGGQVDMFTGRILDPNEVKQQIIEYYGKTKSIINPNAGVDGRNRGSETTGAGSRRISLESAQAKFDAAITTEEKYKAALEITLILDEQNNRKTIVAKDNEDFISMLPTEYSEVIRVKVVAGVFFEGNVIINAEKLSSGQELILAYEHEYAHNANRNVHSSDELDELWNNSTDKKILPRVYLGSDDNIKGDELIAHIIEDIIQKQGYENYKNRNIDLSLYSQQEQLKKTIDYANKEYLRNARGGNSKGNLYEDNNARKGNENLQQTDEGRQTPKFRRKDQGELTEVKRNVQKDVPQGSSRVLQPVTTETLLIDGVERPTRNSNGAYIHSTEDGVRNFYAWFGNSKVTDEKGRPLVVYHGMDTNKKFNVFNPNKTNWFTPTKNYAKAFGDKFIFETYAKAENPLYVGNIDGIANDKALQRLSDYSGINADKLKGILKEENGGNIFYITNSNSFKDLMIEKGYDSLEANEAQGLKTFGVFSPSQIKSATDNLGTFDPNNADIRFAILGERGATALDKAEEATTRLDNLGIAKEMEKGNKTPIETRLATGWEKGVDGKWRYEVPDFQQKLLDERIKNAEKLSKGKPVDLVDFIEDKELFTAYPQLRWIQVRFDKTANSQGSYNKLKGDGGFGQIIINPDNHTNDKEIQSTLLHEIQHAIQDIEGFARGGNVNDIGLRNKLSEAGVTTISELQEKIKILKKEYGKIYQEWYNKAFFSGRYKGQKAETSNLLREWQKIETDIKKLEDNTYDFQKAFKEYQRLAGEVEARNASTRMNFTPEQRLSTLLSETADVAIEDQIVLMEGMGAMNLENSPTDLETIKQQAITDGTFMKAPNGRPTNLNERQWLQTRTPEFKAWFGNWINDAENASKVVDDNGEPKPLYHETNADWNIYDKSKLKAGKSDYVTPNGIFLKSTSDRIGLGDKQVNLYASIKNPIYARDRESLESFFRLNVEGYSELVDQINKTDKDYGKRVDDEQRINTDKYLEEREKFKGEIPSPEWSAIVEEYSKESSRLISEWGDIIDELSLKAKDLLNNYIENSEYDGILLSHDKGSWGRQTDAIIALNPSQIKSATDNTGGFSESSADIRFSIKSPIGFYSTVENALDKIQQEKGTKEQFKRMLLNNGAKQAEMDWMGFDELPEKLTKSDIQNWIDENRIEVEEVEKGGDVSESEIESLLNDEVGEGMTRQEAIEYLQNDEGNEQPKFSEYVLPGGENYRELLLTMPVKEVDYTKIEKQFGLYEFSEVLYGKNYDDLTTNELVELQNEFNKRNPEKAKQLSEQLRKAREKENSVFKSSHFDEPNILAHVRFDERTVNGERVLFIEEIQSDWNQSIKKKGIKQGYDKKSLSEVPEERYKEMGVNPDNFSLISFKNEQGQEEQVFQIQKSKYPTIEDAINYISREKVRNEGEPDNPFKKTDQWVNLALRRMLRWAAENSTPGNSEWISITKPQSVREQLDNNLSSELAAIIPLKVMDIPVLLATKDNEIRRQVIQSIPIDVMNILSEYGIMPESLFSKGYVFSDIVPIEARSSIARGLTSALQLVGTRLRAAFDRILSSDTSRRNEEVLPAISARQLDPSIIVGLLSPSRIYGVDGNNSVLRHSGTLPTTELPVTGINNALVSRKWSSAELASLLNWHDNLINSSSNTITKYVPNTGFDRLAWANGTQQADRYDLSKQVKEIEYSKQGEQYDLKVRDNNDNPIVKGVYSENELEDIVGKEIANKIVSGEGKETIDKTKSLTGVDLKVGGEGMKAFYDAIVPSAMNKLGKPFGAKVENVVLPLEKSNDFEIETELYADGTGVAVRNNAGDRIAEFDTEKEANDFILSKTSSTQQSIPVTESMKETVMEGIPLFSIKAPKFDSATQSKLDAIEKKYNETEYKASVIEFGISDKGNTFGTALDKNVHHELIAEYLKEGFNGLGYTYKTGSEPIIYHAKSGTIYVEAAGREIRISDHIGRGGIFTPTNDIYNLNQAKEILAKTKTYEEVEAINKLDREKSKAEHDILVAFNDELKERGLGYKVNNRTYQPIEEFIQGKNGIIDVKTTVLNNGAFRYEYLAPIDSYTSFAPKSYMDWYNSSDNPRFSIKAPKFESGASLKEMVTTSNMFIAARADKYGAKGRRMVESEIKTVGRAISEQTANLKESANLVTDMVKALLNNGSMNNMTRAELSQILTNVRNASNKKDLTKEFDKISSIVRQIQLRNAKRRFNDLMKFKVQDKNAKGISIASTVDDETVSIITTIRKSLKELTLEDVENQINEINNLDKKTTSDETKLVGLGIARDYLNEIKTREAQLSELSEELSKAKDDLVGKKGEERIPNKELVDSIENMVGQVRSEMTSAYDDLSARLNKIIAEGKEALKNIKLQDKERVATLSHFVNSDMKGIEPKNNPEKGRTFKQWLKSNLIISPLQSFDFILRSLASNQVAGNGYLHDHFSRGILKASQDAYEGTESAFKMLDEAVAKIFGDKFTFRYISARDFKKMSKYELTYGTEKSSTTITATNGQLAYVYAVNKMTDGAMKLRAMGISEEQVEEMKAALPVRIVKLVDAIQDEILPKLRVKYNNAHLEIFNTSMASIENYFPLHIDKTSLTQKVDLEEESNKLSGLIKNSTKSIIKRTVNTKPIDIRNSDFSDILTEHIKDMEQWAAFASIRRDMNTLLSNRNFLNRLIELGGFEYMVQFKRAAAIAVDVYQPLSDTYDAAITGVARSVAMSKVMLNLYTAFKQTLSVVAYLTEPSPKFQGKVLVNLVKGHASFKWAKDNLPDFRKRWESSALGDEKLSRQFANIASEGDFVKFMDASQKVAQKYGMYPNKMVDSYICAVGAKALYETNYDRYISMGATEEKARERALVDAANLYNTTQQSSESMFVSSVQLDRTFFSTAYTVFNNSSLAYNRQVFDAAKNLKNAFNNRSNLIENRTKFNMRTFNVSEEAAKKAATKEVDIQIMRDVLRLAVFGYGVQLIWRLGASFPYLLFGDDDDKKKKIVKEAATGGALITPIRGLLFGATFESFIDAAMPAISALLAGETFESAMSSNNMNMALDRLTGNIHPVVSDVDQLAKAAFSKSLTIGKAGYLLVNLFTKLGFGIDLKAFSNATYGFVELMDSDELTANDVVIDIMSMLSVPQSQLKALALDNPETFFDRYIELKELVDYGLLAPVLELNPDDLDNYITSGRRYMRREMKEKVEK